MCQGQRGQGERLDGGGRLCPHQKLATIEALDPDAGEWPQHERDNLSRKAHDAEQQRRIRQAVDQPGGRQACHPRADHRDALTQKEQLEVSGSQRPPGVRQRAARERAFPGVRTDRASVHDSVRKAVFLRVYQCGSTEECSTS